MTDLEKMEDDVKKALDIVRGRLPMEREFESIVQQLDTIIKLYKNVLQLQVHLHY